MTCPASTTKRTPICCCVCNTTIEDKDGDPIDGAAIFFVGEYSTPEQCKEDAAEVVLSWDEIVKLRHDGKPEPDALPEVIAAHDVAMTCGDCRRAFMAVTHVVFAHFGEVREQLLALLKPVPNAQKPH